MLGRLFLKSKPGQRSTCSGGRKHMLCMNIQHCSTLYGESRVDGTRSNDRLVCDLKKDRIRNSFLWMVSLANRDKKGGKTMRQFCRRVKACFKSGISSVFAFCKQNKKSIIRLVGKFVIYVCKTVIELFLDNLF